MQGHRMQQHNDNTAIPRHSESWHQHSSDFRSHQSHSNTQSFVPQHLTRCSAAHGCTHWNHAAAAAAAAVAATTVQLATAVTTHSKQYSCTLVVPTPCFLCTLVISQLGRLVHTAGLVVQGSIRGVARSTTPQRSGSAAAGRPSRWRLRSDSSGAAAAAQPTATLPPPPVLHTTFPLEILRLWHSSICTDRRERR